MDEALLTRGQAFAQSLMVDQCRIERGADTDPDSGAVTSGQQILYAETPCRLQQRGAPAGQPLDSGNEAVLVQRLEVQLPVAVVGLQVGDRITWLASRDPDLVGRVFVIHDPARKTDATARRIGVHERTR